MGVVGDQTPYLPVEVFAETGTRATTSFKQPKSLTSDLENAGAKS
jgi:hypothetical protein